MKSTVTQSTYFLNTPFPTCWGWKICWDKAIRFLFHRISIPGIKASFYWQVNNKSLWKLLALFESCLFLELFTCYLYGQCLNHSFSLLMDYFLNILFTFVIWNGQDVGYGVFRVSKNVSYTYWENRYRGSRVAEMNSHCDVLCQIEILTGTLIYKFDNERSSPH